MRNANLYSIGYMFNVSRIMDNLFMVPNKNLVIFQAQTKCLFNCR